MRKTEISGFSANLDATPAEEWDILPGSVRPKAKAKARMEKEEESHMARVGILMRRGKAKEAKVEEARGTTTTRGTEPKEEVKEGKVQREDALDAVGLTTRQIAQEEEEKEAGRLTGLKNGQENKNGNTEK